MIHWLIYLGLAVTPFIFAPGRVDPAREPKMAWAVILALLIGLYATYKGKLIRFKNKYIVALVFYVLLLGILPSIVIYKLGRVHTNSDLVI